MKELFFVFIIILSFTGFSCAQQQKSLQQEEKSVAGTRGKSFINGADQFGEYLSLLTGQRVALVVNHTSLVGKTHLTDTLLSLGTNIVKIFAPEHGFRGMAEAGETVKNDTDVKTGLPIVSLYGKNKKPSPEQLQDVDILIFDIQDVGARFYTYISTMHYIMEAAAENRKTVIILDRPNPNGHYFDGPVLEIKNQSFVGMHPIPIVHGLTVGELAGMINGEKWLHNGKNCDLKVIKVKNYSHNDAFSVPVKPSPNMPNDLAIKLYPSLCLFEGTNISIARGTQFPFQAIGYPDPAFGKFTFTPVSIEGMAKNPPHENKLCYGIDFRAEKQIPQFTLKYLIDYYRISKEKDKYFNSFFIKLSGTDALQKQIESGMSEEEIRKTWKPQLDNYRQVRKKYLLYQDFE